jgi:protein involved in polysaccharide export with SLBB domain
MSISSAPVRWVAGVAAAMWLACAPHLAAAAPGSTLRVGDTVLVTVYNHPDLSGQHVINSDGTVTLLLVGAISAAGGDATQLQASVTRAMRVYLPYVAVSVQRQTEGASISVAGWPYPIADGSLKYVPGQKLLDVIALIRNAPQLQSTLVFDPYHSKIDMRSVYVARDDATLGPYDAIALAARGESGPVLRPGDTVRFVNKPIEVDVRGAVKQPGLAYLALDEPLADAIDQVGGFADNAMSADIAVRETGHDLVLLSIGDHAFHAPLTANATVDVPAAPQVTVGGIVLHPGAVMLKADPSLLAAVFGAGGPDKFGDLGHVSVIHAGTVKVYDVTLVARGNESQNPRLADGDQVYVPHGRQMDNTILASLMNSLRWILFP